MDFKGPPCQAQEGVLGGFIGSRWDVRTGWVPHCLCTWHSLGAEPLPTLLVPTLPPVPPRGVVTLNRLQASVNQPSWAREREAGPHPPCKGSRGRQRARS